MATVERWQEAFLIDPATGRKPAADFLDGLSDKAAQQIVAVVRAVRDAPPYRFSGGGKWEAMRDEMAGFFEVRTRESQTLHRLFCLLDRNLDPPTLVLVSGGSKPNKTAMPSAVYDEAQRLRDIYDAKVADGKAAEVLSRG